MKAKKYLKLSGLEPLIITPQSNFINVGERTNVVWLPPQAIREFRGRQFVVVEEGDGQRRVDIEVGLANRQRVEIIAGLEPGQIVIGE